MTSIMIVGVGGQGTLLASRIIGNLLVDYGMDVKVSEVHGMAQRGGSVVTYVKFGEKVHSPIINEGEADYILAFEQLEAYRWLPYLKCGGTLITNTQKISPMPVITGVAKYPEQIIEKLTKTAHKAIAVDALEIANRCGNHKAVNIVLLGTLARQLNIEKQAWLNAISNTVPKKFLDINIKAFAEAFNLA